MGEAVSDVFCNNCGHRNASGSNYCSSCGAPLEIEAEDPPTITFFPTQPADSVDEELELDVADVPPDTGALLAIRGPNAGSRFLLEGEVTTVGRHPDSDIFLDDITVSRRHVEVRRDGAVYRVSDAGSLNGTYVNRERIDEPRQLESGDELQVGKFKLHFFHNPTPAEG
ncbi:MAG: zinc-ribbon and FHA domain-containing protein [Acidimicrobiia bacterium]|nr:zinc-ribbon and FHA domain-containing protein [Acidimicrobiia bacterium]